VFGFVLKCSQDKQVEGPLKKIRSAVFRHDVDNLHQLM
jgi:hypothetical protein